MTLLSERTINVSEDGHEAGFLTSIDVDRPRTMPVSIFVGAPWESPIVVVEYKAQRPDTGER